MRTISLQLLTFLALTAPTAVAQQEQFETNPDVLKSIAMGGQPLSRWKEGLMFEGVASTPWLKSAANWFPGTEEVSRTRFG